MPALAISHERDQLFQDLEKQPHHANLDEGSVAFAPEIDFPKETQIKESTGFMVPPLGRSRNHQCAMRRHVVAVRAKQITSLIS
jgi:hypothetical protein